MYTRLFHIICLVAAIACAATSAAHAQSLWQHRDPNRVNIYRDSKARNVGDVLTVVVREATGVDNTDQRTGAKTDNASASFGLSGNTASGGSTGDVSASGSVNTSGSRIFNGNSRVSVDRNITDRMTIMVLDVLPNGNLIVGGKRRRVVAGEERTLIISGVVRPLDIAIDNTVESQYVANFRVDYEGHGPDSNVTSRMWFPNLMHSIWRR